LKIAVTSFDMTASWDEGIEPQRRTLPQAAPASGPLQREVLRVPPRRSRFSTPRPRVPRSVFSIMPPSRPWLRRFPPRCVVPRSWDPPRELPERAVRPVFPPFARPAVRPRPEALRPERLSLVELCERLCVERPFDFPFDLSFP
jgi:hypothetical protein